MNDTPDPVEIAVKALLDRWVEAGEITTRNDLAEIAMARQDVEAALAALHAAGWRIVRTSTWRIVRTSTCECGQPDAIHGDAERYPTEERIVEEWTP